MIKSLTEDRKIILKKYEVKPYVGIKKNKYPLEVRKQRGYQLEAISNQTIISGRVKVGY